MLVAVSRKFIMTTPKRPTTEPQSTGELQIAEVFGDGPPWALLTRGATAGALALAMSMGRPGRLLLMLLIRIDISLSGSDEAKLGKRNDEPTSTLR